MKHFSIGLGVLIGVCLVLGGCETPAKAKQPTTQVGDYSRDLPKKGRAAKQDFSGDGSLIPTQTQTIAMEDRQPSSDTIVVQGGPLTDSQAAPHVDQTQMNAPAGGNGGDGYRTITGATISGGGGSRIGASSKPASSGSLSAISTQ